MIAYSFDDPGFRKFAQIAAILDFENRFHEIFEGLSDKFKSHGLDLMEWVDEELKRLKEQEVKTPGHEEQESSKDDGEPVDDNDDLGIAWIENSKELQSSMEICKLSECQKKLLHERWEAQGNLRISQEEHEEFDNLIIDFSRDLYDSNESVLRTEIPREIVMLLQATMLRIWDKNFDELIDNQWKSDDSWHVGVPYIQTSISTPPIIVTRFPREEVLEYLKAMRRSYFNGVVLATIMGSRAVMELVLREIISAALEGKSVDIDKGDRGDMHRNRQPTYDDNKIFELIREAD